MPFKTKFSPLVTVSKNKCDKTERALQECTAQLISAESALNDLIASLGTLIVPSSGNYGEYLAFSARKQEYYQQVDNKRLEIAGLKQTKKRLQQEFELAYRELEKAKYLENMEIKKILAAIKQKEEKDLDEMSVLLYARKKEEIWQ